MPTFAVADLASKRDIADLKQEIARAESGLKQEIARVEGDLKQEIARVDKGLKADIARVDTDLRAVIAQGVLTTRVAIEHAKLDLVTWIVGAMVLGSARRRRHQM